MLVGTQPTVSFVSVWRPSEQDAAFVFVLTDPSPLIAPSRPKAMSVLLDEKDRKRWLRAPLAEAMDLIAAYPAQQALGARLRPLAASR